MYNFLYKYKSSIFTLLKIAIVMVACYFIYQKLTNNNLLSIKELIKQLSFLFSNNIWLIIALLLCTDVNWLLEVYKWKTLVSVEKKLTFMEAFEQSFGSHAVSIITPNKIGEYGAKALFFKKEKRKKILVLNLIGNLYQLITTGFFGISGLTYVILNFDINFKYPLLEKNNYWMVILALILLSIFIIYFKTWISKNIKKTIHYCRQIPKTVQIKVAILAILRYLVFSHQFYFLLILFNIKIEYSVAMSIIFSMYLLASIVPALSIFDWAIKGSVAIWLFSWLHINPLTIATITTLMWLLNFAVPALLGMSFVLNFKLSKQE